nr:MAG TPA: hypothetical protein [Caudoviricetes sp.]
MNHIILYLFCQQFFIKKLKNFQFNVIMLVKTKNRR